MGGAGAGALSHLLVARQPVARVLRALLPSFVADAVFPEHRPAWRLHPTSYLDGLRGVAAVVVFFCHYTENNFSALTPSYYRLVNDPGPDPSSGEGGGAGGGHPSWSSEGSSWLQLPFARVVFSGRPMVHIFFVISGFVLSYKPVRALRARETERCYAALASSAFRRAFRLFGPCVVSTLLILGMRRAGWLPGGGAQETTTLAEELWAWKGAVFHQLTWPWEWDRDLRPAYDVHLWTIPIEFAHSMLLFMVLLMLSRVRVGVRMAAVVGVMGYCLACGKWAGFEFLSGLFLAEVYVLRAARSKEWEGEGASETYQARSSASRWLLKTFQFGLVLLSLFIAGWPNSEAEKTPGIRYFLAQTPMPFAKMDDLAPQKFWFGLSAVATVWAVGDLGFLRRLFESPFAQYCGRISYAVYICHGPVEELFRDWLIGHPIIAAAGEPGTPEYKPALPGTGVKGFVGIETKTQITVGWFVGLWLLAPLVIWAADLFWRGVDNQVVSLARRLEMWCLDDAEPSPRSQGYSTAA
jgi:peptidoglycan/LPS O-acetylase OafA/YrhL